VIEQPSVGELADRFDGLLEDLKACPALCPAASEYLGQFTVLVFDNGKLLDRRMSGRFN
jgi:hypothetical protein